MSVEPKIGAGGCLALIAFFVVEIAAGLGVAALAHPLAQAAMRAIVPARETEFADVCAIVLCMIVAFVVVFMIDRLCRRWTGHSVLDNLPFIP